MWIIVISENKSDSRDSIIDGLLDTKPVEEKFLSKVSTRNKLKLENKRKQYGK
jgi:hypothetical protein